MRMLLILALLGGAHAGACESEPKLEYVQAVYSFDETASGPVDKDGYESCWTEHDSYESAVKAEPGRVYCAKTISLEVDDE